MAVRRVEIVITGDDNGAGRLMAALQVQADKLAATSIDISINLPGLTETMAGLEALSAKLDDIKAKTGDLGNLDIGTADVQAKLALVRAEIDALHDATENIDVDINDAGAIARLAALKAATSALGGQVIAPDFKASDLDLVAHRLLAISYATKTLETSSDTAAPAVRRFLGSVALWGGAAAVGGLHLWIDGLVELFAILGPATVAAVTFGVALAGTAPTLQVIYDREMALYTATDLLNTGLPGLGHSLTSLQAAVKPGVFEVWGDALTVATHGTGEFGQIMDTAVNWVDNFAARVTVALDSSSGAFDKLLQDGARDLALLGNFFGTLGDILVNLFRVTQITHVAEDLLVVATAIATVIKWITELPTPLLAAAIGIHALWLWGGLLATGLIKVGAAVVGFVRDLGLFKAMNAIWPEATQGVTSFLIKMGLLKGAQTDADVLIGATGNAAAVSGAKLDAAADATGVFGKALAFASTPAGAFTVAAGAIVVGLIALAIHFGDAKDATETWITSMNQGIAKVSNNQAFSLLAEDAGLVSQQIHAMSGAVQTTMNGPMGRWGPYMTSAGQDTNALKNELGGLTGQMTNFGTGVGWVMARFHVTYPEALAIATQANVKLTSSLYGSSTAAKVAQQKIIGLVTGFTQLQTPAGLAGQDFMALAYDANDITSKISQLDSSWDAWEKSVTGSQSAFDTFAQGLQTMSTSGGTLTERLGDLKDVYTYTRSPIDKLTTSGIALNQAFMDEAGNLGSWADAMRTAGMAADGANDANSQLVKGMKAGVAAMLPYAAGSKEATSVLYALAQQADYTGGDSIKNLADWAGIKAPAALAILKAQTNSATTAASSLANTISNLLNVQFQNDIVKASGASAALEKYTQDLVNNKSQTDAGRSARAQLIADLEKTGMSASAATSYVDHLSVSLGKIPKNENASINVNAKGQVSVSENTAAISQLLSGKGTGVSTLPLPGGRKSGWRVPGFGGGDKWPALLEGGEAVVPKHLVPAIEPFLHHHKVPGFASGGIAGVGNYTGSASGISNWSGEAYAGINNAAITDTTKALASAMLGAASAMNSFSGATTKGNVAGWIMQALRITHEPMSWLGTLERLVSMESSGNPTAVDPISVGGQHASGLFQTLPSTFAAYSLGGSMFNAVADAVAGIRYIASRYGSPMNIPGLLGGNYHGYANEGWIREPVFGVGMRSGSAYGIAENGAEYVGHQATSGGNTYHIYTLDDTYSDARALRTIQTVRKYKTRHGNVPTGIG
jgi:hypothetical protein